MFPLFFTDASPYFSRELKLYGINVPPVSGAVDLSYPTSSVVLVLPWSRLPSSFIKDRLKNIYSKKHIVVTDLGEGTAL